MLSYCTLFLPAIYTNIAAIDTVLQSKHKNVSSKTIFFRAIVIHRCNIGCRHSTFEMRRISSLNTILDPYRAKKALFSGVHSRLLSGSTTATNNSGRMIDDVFKRYSVAVVTPFTAPSGENGDQSIDEEGIQSVVLHVCSQLAALRAVSSDVGGIIVSGTTGEQHLMSIEERSSLYAMVIKYAKTFNVPVACGIAATTSRDAGRLAEAAEAAGCQGIMLGLPPYIRANDVELTSYVRTVKSKLPSTTPILLYNNVMRNGYSPSLETIASWHQSGLIYGMKYAIAPHSEFLSNACKILALDASLPLYTGSDALFPELIKPGTLSNGLVDGFDRVFYGLTSIVGNILPTYTGQTVLTLVDPATHSAGVELHVKVAKLAQATLLNVSVPVGVKYAMTKVGLNAGVARLPLGVLTAEKKQEIDSVLESPTADAAI
jgi:4-hydroxy-tetrahydrodipicolinate synthase